MGFGAISSEKEGPGFPPLNTDLDPFHSAAFMYIFKKIMIEHKSLNICMSTNQNGPQKALAHGNTWL